MCFPQTPRSKCSTKDTYNLLIVEVNNKNQVETGLQVIDGFYQISIDLLELVIPKLVEDKQPLEFAHNAYGIFNAPLAFIKEVANFESLTLELNLQF